MNAHCPRAKPYLRVASAASAACTGTATNIQALKYYMSSLFLADEENASGGSFASAAFVLIAMSVGLVSIASGLVLFIEPIAGGSGIPEVKTYLQGCRIPRMLRVSTLTCKALGVLCSVSGGLVCGKEGPMIHAGAIIAGGFSQGSSKTFKCRTAFLKRFRNDHDKRDFVSAGAAAGVAAAFGAPIGGVLFALEEAATHWSQQLTWRTFFCAICSTGCLNFLLSSTDDNGAFFGILSHPGLIVFGSFMDCQGEDVYNFQELTIFIVIGIVCGFLGAAFNSLNRRLTILRGKRLRSSTSRLMEALIIAALTALCSCLLPFLLPCVPTPLPHPVHPPHEFLATAPLAPSPPALFAHPAVAAFASRRVGSVRNADRCDPVPNPLQNVTHHYVCGEAGLESPLVRLLLNPHEEGIKTLFHAPASHGMGPQVCLVFFVFSFVFGLLTYGLALPSGLFVPCIMAGAAIGRLVGEFLGPLFGDTTPGNYALIGAAGMLGGICRMTISITVIVIESTGNVVYSIPIAVTIMFAKLTGDFFTEGIYDLHVHLKGYPVLPDQPPDERAHLQASDVMAREVKTVSEYEQVGTLLKLLRHTAHHGFPVTAGGGGGVIGIILRDQLITILSNRRFESRRPVSPHLGSYFQHHAGPNSQQPPLSADDFLRPWEPTKFDQLALSFTPEDLVKVVDLRPYINESSAVLMPNTSLRRASRLFLTMGLRHLLVVESCPKVVGIVTRRDLIYAGEPRTDGPVRALNAGLPLALTDPREVRWLRRLRSWTNRSRLRLAGRTAASDTYRNGDGPSLHSSRNGSRTSQMRGPLITPMLSESATAQAEAEAAVASRRGGTGVSPPSSPQRETRQARAQPGAGAP